MPRRSPRDRRLRRTGRRRPPRTTSRRASRDATQWTSSVRPAGPRTLRRERGVGPRREGRRHEPSEHLARGRRPRGRLGARGDRRIRSNGEHAGGRDPDASSRSGTSTTRPTTCSGWTATAAARRGWSGTGTCGRSPTASSRRRASSPRRARRSSSAASTRTAIGAAPPRSRTARCAMTFQATIKVDPVTFVQIQGRCHHPITGGTGDFEARDGDDPLQGRPRRRVLVLRGAHLAGLTRPTAVGALAAPAAAIAHGSDIVQSATSGAGGDVAVGRRIAAGDVVAGYEIGALVGRGGMGDVYRAFDSRLERPVALKLLGERSPTTRASESGCSRESRLAAEPRPPERRPDLRGGRGRRPAVHRDALRRRHRSQGRSCGARGRSRRHGRWPSRRRSRTHSTPRTRRGSSTAT